MSPPWQVPQGAGGNGAATQRVPLGMSSHSGGGFFGHSRSSGRRRGGFLGHSRSSGHRRGGMLGGLMGGSSSGHRGRYVQGGHYRPQRRGLGCLGAFVIGAVSLESGVAGLVSLVG